MVSRRLFLTISAAIAALFTTRRSVSAERHALLGLGKGKGDIRLLTGEGDGRFKELMRARKQAEL